MNRDRENARQNLEWDLITDCISSIKMTEDLKQNVTGKMGLRTPSKTIGHRT